MSDGTEREIEEFLDERLAEHDAPGATVAVFDADGVLYTDAVGARSLDPVTPATPDSLFHVASVTKSFTAIAVLQFVEAGALALDDPISGYVEFFGDVPGDSITVDELLAHTSGIPSDAGSPAGAIADVDDLVRRIDRWADERLHDRNRPMYFNWGYVVLGALVAALADRPYAEHVTEAVLEPMGMDRSTFDQVAIEDDTDAMAGYVGDGDDVEPSPVDPAAFPAVREGLFGVGGLISTVTDLAAVGPLLLDGGIVDGEPVLEPETAAAMTSPQSPAVPTVEGLDVHLGHGWLLEDLLGDTLVYGGGGVPGYGTFVGVLREHGLGVALGVNKSGLSTVDVGQGVLALACGVDPFETVRWYRARDAVETARGTYEAARTGSTATVEPAGEGPLGTKIEVSIDDGIVFRAAPELDDGEGHVFSSVVGHGFRWTVEFSPGDDGWVMLWTRGHRGVRFDER